VAEWLWWGVLIALSAGGVLSAAVAVFCVAAMFYLRIKFLPQVVRVFEEKPLFIVPRGQRADGAEDVAFPTADGLLLRGCYLRTPGPRKGVILFGGEFGSNRWAAVQYCGALLESGYDVFAYEPRNQGECENDPAYAPLQWVTDKDAADLRAAIAYLKTRPDAPTEGVGIFGISKGGSTGFLAAANDPWVRCLATDGAYATYTTMVPYMRRWVSIYSPAKRNRRIQEALPNWVYGAVALTAMGRVSITRGVSFPQAERAVRRMQQPLLMIHGAGDNYIKPAMAETLYRMAGSRSKELWVVPKAKHNQAAHVAGDEYHQRLVEFFDRYLGQEQLAPAAV
jgi:pimeloyl-ACP methyl ester carboxylesterase